ncbi:hypothetical protein SAMD00019534_073450 [Acytostelium subglobosum LB1]|uniref:hypothetical protein n=1 Tax=Acytostelium subglobosum LB1 TaxID=1410327 RepID=UPI0006451C9F|nr:hypothetical protein SAMD00019534_073450 [Acytostelium subglobosum LB1]GAM24170.1 hypothetical protein SAMD00019534_073450 [Acytostelium subglobosum LB1]|eukprot:XP_012753206.1 hypothetical protein SAMD00019534_073450 [Acytostelium subglobosum LB1]
MELTLEVNDHILEIEDIFGLAGNESFVPHLPVISVTIEGFEAIRPGALPDTLKMLCFSHHYSEPLQVGCLPSSLTVLDLGKIILKIPITPGVLPHSVQRLRFPTWYNIELEPGTLPRSLIQLKLGYNFNQRLGIGLLPSSLTKLKLGYEFNIPIEWGVLPTTLLSLKFGKCFNQSVSWPQSLETLCINRDYDPKSKDTPPSSLRYINILSFVNHSNFLNRCQSIKGLKIRVIDDISEVLIPDGIHSIKLKFKTNAIQLKQYLKSLLEVNQQVTSISMRLGVYRFEVLILDSQKGWFAAWVSYIYGMSDTSKLMFLNLVDFLSASDTGLNELYPPYDKKHHQNDDVSSDNESSVSGSYDLSEWIE